MSNINKTTLKKLTDPLIEYFKKNKEKELTESIIAKDMGLKKNQMRLVLANVRYKIPIMLIRNHCYMFTIENKDLLQKEATKLENIIKEKKKKLSLIKKYL